MFSLVPELLRETLSEFFFLDIFVYFFSVLTAKMEQNTKEHLHLLCSGGLMWSTVKEVELFFKPEKKLIFFSIYFISSVAPASLKGIPFTGKFVAFCMEKKHTEPDFNNF